MDLVLLLGFIVLVAFFLFYVAVSSKGDHFEGQIREMKADAFEYVLLAEKTDDPKEQMRLYGLAEKLKKEINVLLDANPHLDRALAFTMPALNFEVDTSHVDKADWASLIRHYAYDNKDPFPKQSQSNVVQADFKNKNR